ncbi:unnamed protein product [Rotaria sordida]|uniref:RRM domain-containing protein n=1 Tax=Rotaria sordida TaxID=392033 RepID=A0A818M355_9BILA|nr:unnamed protein product [Rotaria sordida]CAF0980456.1 unnamed protein product [Rotaria sordida]CAF3532439.1 unnamed protein product [Rotaria sordida]CAF3574462.1 unnamed protein product [Rotaria sordida]
MPTKLYIGNISHSVSSTELKELFEKYGKVLECDIIKDYAFVHMEDASKAKASIAALNEFNLKGSRIRVEVSTTQFRNSDRSSRRGESPRHQSNSTSMRSSRNRGYPMMSSNRSGGPDRSYPRMRNSYMNARSRPYDSPYERQRIPPPPPPPMNYPDPYGMRGGPVDPYGRDDFYHQRAPPITITDHYGRGPPMRRYAASPPSSRNASGRYAGSPSRSSSSHRSSRRSPLPSSSSSSSRPRR